MTDSARQPRRKRLGTPAKLALIGAVVVLVVGGVFGGIAIAGSVALSNAKSEFSSAQHVYDHDAATDVAETAQLAKSTTAASALDRSVSGIVAQGSGLVGIAQLTALTKAATTLHADAATTVPAAKTRKIRPTGSPNAGGYRSLAQQQRAQSELVTEHTASVERRVKTVDADTQAAVAALQQVAGSVPATSAAVLLANASAGDAQKTAFNASVAAVKSATPSTLAARLAAYLAAGAALEQSNSAEAATQQAAHTVLGVPSAEGGDNTIGFGQVQPGEIYLGGDPTGDLQDITWASWGGPQATGQGTAPDVTESADGTVAGAPAVTATVVAWDPMICDGTLTYTEFGWYFPQDGQTQSAADWGSQSYVGDNTCIAQ
jgi:hypothetical protein